MACPINPADCVVPNPVEAAAGSANEQLLAAISEAITQSTNAMLTVWMRVPSPNPLRGAEYGDPGWGAVPGEAPAPLPSDPQLMPALQTTWGSLWALTAAFAVLGIIWAVVQVVRQNSAAGFMPALKMVVAVVAVTGFAVPAMWLLVQFCDYYSVFIMNRATGNNAESLLRDSDLFVAEQFTKLGLVSSGLTAIIIVFSNLAQVAFMLIRSGLLIVLLGVWPTVAAATGTETGMAAFKKLNAWLLAFILFKPVAATIYALGLMLFETPVASQVEGQSYEQTLMQVMQGAVILLLALLALPALIKFTSPPAGIGASSAFSGGAAIGAVATGAVAVAGIAATGGASAAASGAAAGSGAAGAAAGGGAAGGAASGGAAGGAAATETGAASSVGGSSSAGGGGGVGGGAGAGGSGSSGDGGGSESPAGSGGGSTSAGSSGGGEGSELPTSDAGSTSFPPALASSSSAAGQPAQSPPTPTEPGPVDPGPPAQLTPAPALPASGGGASAAAAAVQMLQAPAQAIENEEPR